MRRSAALAVLAAAIATGAAAQVRGDFDAIGHVKGDPSAPIEIIEFADFACTFCGQFARETMPALERGWIETGRARFRFVSFNLSYFKPGRHAARAAECAAAQDGFWALHDVLYERQKEWLGKGGQKEKFSEWVAALGLDVERFLACWEENPGEADIERNMKLASSNRVRATPTFFVNGKRVEGALSLADFTAVLEAAQVGVAALELPDGPASPCGKSFCSAPPDAPATADGPPADSERLGDFAVRPTELAVPSPASAVARAVIRPPFHPPRAHTR